MADNFKIYLLTPEFQQICDWSMYKIPIVENRPVMILVIQDYNYPNCFCCIPISKDDDKKDKYKNLSIKKPDLVYPININRYDNYLLIQNMFYVREEFVGTPFLENGLEIEILNVNHRKQILNRARKLDALMKHGKITYVPREKVYDMQISYLASKESDKAKQWTD